MKFMFYIIVIALFTTFSFSDVKYECDKQCRIVTKGISEKPTGDLNCTLPNMSTFPITAPNVLNSDGTLKKYFETKNDVCDVLGLKE